MKKAGLFVITLLLLSLISIVSAEEAPGLDQALGDDKITGAIQNLSAEETRSEYLKQEWAKVAQKNAFIGPVIGGMDKVLNVLSPFFKIILGYEYQMSWAFIFAVIIWFMFFFLFTPIASQATKNALIGILIAFILSSLIGLTGAIKKAVDLLTLVILNNWMAIIGAVIAIIFVFIFDRIGRTIKKYMKKSQEEEEKEKTARAQQVIQLEGKVTKEKLEATSGVSG